MLSIIFGLCAALGWGAGDFTGGLASRKTGAYRAVFYSEVIGIVFLFFILGVTSEPVPNLKVWLLSMLAGAIGTFGLILLYHAMTIGLMSIAAPVSALLGRDSPCCGRHLSGKVFPIPRPSSDLDLPSSQFG